MRQPKPAAQREQEKARPKRAYAKRGTGRVAMRKKSEKALQDVLNSGGTAQEAEAAAALVMDGVREYVNM